MIPSEMPIELAKQEIEQLEEEVKELKEKLRAAEDVVSQYIDILLPTEDHREKHLNEN